MSKITKILIFLLFTLVLMSLSVQAHGTTHLIYETKYHSGNDVRWSPDGSRLAVVASSKLHMLDAMSWINVYSREVANSQVTWNPDGTQVATIKGASASDENMSYLYIWDTETGMLIHEYARPKCGSEACSYINITSYLAWSPDGQYIASDGRRESGDVVLWNVDSGFERVIGQHPSGAVLEVAWSPDSKFLVSGGGNYYRVWDIQASTLLFEFEGLGIVDWHPVQDIVATLQFGYFINIWNVSSQVQVAELKPLVVSFLIKKSDHWNWVGSVA